MSLAATTLCLYTHTRWCFPEPLLSDLLLAICGQPVLHLRFWFFQALVATPLVQLCFAFTLLCFFGELQEQRADLSEVRAVLTVLLPALVNYAHELRVACNKKLGALIMNNALARFFR